MTVYKYVTPERVDVLTTGRLRFTQAAALNDPFETHPCLTLLRESFEERARKLVDSVQGRFNATSIVAGRIMIPKKVRDGSPSSSAIWPKSILCSVSQEKGVTYLSGLIMPTLIADSSLALIPIPFFHREKPRTMTPLDEVRYSNKRPVMPPFEEITPENVHQLVFLTKSEHWAYEEELRMFAQPRTANGVETDSRGFNIYLFDLTTDIVVEIIFGLLMSPNIKHEIAAIVENRYPDIELYETTLNETDFDLDILPYRRR
jgi:hypothetical protein